MTVGELRELLEGVPDSYEVLLDVTIEAIHYGTEDATVDVTNGTVTIF